MEWIPMWSLEKPKNENDVVLFCTKEGVVFVGVWERFRFDENTIAWMPFPEPYKLD